MTDFEELSSRFECTKLGMRHTKEGLILSFAIHPNELPHDVIKDFLGTRYLAVLVRLSEEDTPVPSKDMEEGARAVRVAGSLCKNEDFQAWMVTGGLAEEVSEEAAVEGLRTYLGITSRKELRTNATARSKLSGLAAEFSASYR